tara:strand:- start:720 stop:1412 length:693 start_codon:yes stop_codon:yes gene_type:complete
MTRGRFITLEGGEGTGKTTQIQNLHRYLTGKGIDCIVTREPGGTPEAEKIRDLLVQREGGDWDPMSEALLLFAARREHLAKKIWPALEKGKWVISDRFVDSSRVYQGDALGLGSHTIEALYFMIAEEFSPDLTFIMDIDPEEGLKRSGKQNQMSLDLSESTEDRYERLGLGFHEKVRKGFLNIAKNDPKRCVIVDASQSQEDIFDQLKQILELKYGIKSGKDAKVAHGTV